MFKLTDAKCPSCGAKLDVNPNLEKTICQYCGSTVFVEEAIQKFKLELSGKVEVEGIKGRNTKIKQALKYKKIKEYDKASNLLKEIIQDDEFDIEALCEIIKLDLEILENSNFDEKSSEPCNPDGWRAVSEIMTIYKRIDEIDDDKESVSMLKDYKDKIEHYIEAAEKLKKDNLELDKYLVKLKKQYDVLYNINIEGCLGEWNEAFVNKFGYKNEYYDLSALKRIARDGILVFDEIDEYYDDLKFEEAFAYPKTKYDSVESLKKDLDEFLEFSEQYINEKRNEKNFKIDKANKKTDRKNAVINVKIKFCYLKIVLYSLIILFFVIFTFAAFVSDGWVSGLLIVIFIDSWAILLPKSGIDNNLYKIKMQKKQIELNQKNKADHI